jgi:hypothetical protein
MTPVSDALVLTGLVTFAAAFPVVAVAGPHAGLVTAAVGVALMAAGAVVGGVQWAVRR